MRLLGLGFEEGDIDKDSNRAMLLCRRVSGVVVIIEQKERILFMFSLVMAERRTTTRRRILKSIEGLAINESLATKSSMLA